MSLRDDRRGRVPFALVGVVLLLGSLVYAHGVAVRGPTTTDRAADRALTQASTTARPVVHSAAEDAARAAARNPVIVPANTTAGRALDPDHPFRDALALRIYRRVADALAVTPTRVGRLTVTSSLPQAAELRAAIDRVTVESVRNDTAIRVRIDDVTHEARRDGRVVARHTESITVTVATPVLALHDRTARYERLLNRGPTDGPGLGRHLTARLVPIAAARGLAQRSGVGIGNVVSNRHVELSTNGAALALQRRAFGRADADGERAFLRATARVGTTDLLKASRVTDDPWADAVLGEGRRETADRVALAPNGTAGTTTVGVNRTADAAFVAADDRLEELLRAAYRVHAVRRVSVSVRARERRPALVPPGPNWTAIASHVENRTRVTGARPIDPTAAGRPLNASRRTVTVTHVRRTQWQRGARTRTTRVRWTTTYTVRLVLVGRYDPVLPGPDRPVSLDGGLAPAWDAARDRLPVTGAAADDLARRAVRDGGWIDRRRVSIDPPRSARTAAVRDLSTLRDRVRNVTVTVPSRRVATGDANPPRRSQEALTDRRETLLDAPARYDGVRDRLRVATRAAYLDATRDRLTGRAKRASGRDGRLQETLSGVAGRLGDRFRAASRAAARAARPEPRPLGDGPAGRVVVAPDARPSYLTVTSVDPRLVDGVDRRVTPLAARNVNPFTLPYGDAASNVVRDLLPTGDRVPLRAAARTAVGARTTVDRARAAARLRNGSDRSAAVDRLDARHATLERRLSGALDRVDARARTVLRARLDDRVAAAKIVRDVRRAYDGPGPAALAATDGRYATRIADRAARRANLSETRRDRLAAHLRVAVGERAADTTIDRSVVNRTVRHRRTILRNGLAGELDGVSQTAVTELHEQLDDEVDGAVPPLAGLPVAPAPGYWYATVNVWLVELRGEYPRFVAAARVNDTTRVEYVRTNRVVSFDADGDGRPERVGRNRPVTFATRAAAFAVVPGGGGVGDTTADERSGAWACPGGPACDRSTAHLHSRYDGATPISGMLYETARDGETTPAAVRNAYGDRLRAAVDGHDSATLATETGVDSAVVERFAAGEIGDATLTDAASVLGFTEDLEPDAIAAEIRDRLMLGMSNAILDVDSVASEIDTDLTGQEIQQALEGRTRLTLRELAAVQALIADRTR